jgi:adenosylhomocysteine nucleosidase
MSMTPSQSQHTTLICFALKEEAAPFLRFARKNPSLQILVTGMGKRNTEKSFRAALEQQRPALVLTCGFAGGLDPRLNLGAVVYDADPDTGLIGTLEKLGAKQTHFHCAPRILVTSAEKRSVREATGDDAVEMESHYIRALCREQKIPSATIRVISDTADEEMPLDFNTCMTPDDRVSITRIMFAMLKSPGNVPALLAFQKKSALAAKNLARVLTGLLSAPHRM